MPYRSILRFAVVGAVFSALLAVGVPTAHARWGHELDLGVRMDGRWIGFGLARRSADPSDFVIKRGVGFRDTVVTLVRIRKLYRSSGNATIRGCGLVAYLVDGVDVTRQVTDGGYTMKNLEAGHTDVRVIARDRGRTYRCAIKVSSAGRVHDALLLEVVHSRWK